MDAENVESLRGEVAREALSWLGTPYHHHARLKGVGVDCAQILAAVYGAVGLSAPGLDLGDYAREWHLHQGEELYLQRLRACGARPVDAAAVGDVVVFRFGRTYSHGAIVVEAGVGAAPVLVHSYVGSGVILTRMDEAPLVGRLYCFWTLMP